MKKVILSVLIIVGLVCGCSSKESEPEKNVEIILDVQQFCGMSEAELIEKMGEPESREEWNYEVGNLYSPIKYSLQGTTQGRYLTGGVPPVRFSM